METKMTQIKLLLFWVLSEKKTMPTASATRFNIKFGAE